MITVMLSGPGREQTTYRAVADVEQQNPRESFVVYRTVDPVVVSFDKLVAAAVSMSEDLLYLEDDIITARNFIAYARAWSSPHVTSFMHNGRHPVGEPVNARTFALSQAVKIPWAVGHKLVRRRTLGSALTHGPGPDDELAHALSELSLPVVYHRSLVQHVGAESLFWGPDKTLDHRTAPDFPGLDFDCLTLSPRQQSAPI